MPLEGLFPRGGPRPTSSQAERNLYDALKGALPKGWVAWHSLKVRTDQGVEGESDFVIADPDRGFLIVEVKGGQIEVRDGQWLQNGSPLKKSPREQGHRVARAVRQKLEERGRGYSTFRIVTAFPDTGWDQPPTQGDLEGAVLGRADLPYLSDALPAIADRLWQSGERGRPDRSMVRGLHEIWGETWKPSMGLGTRAKLREEELVPLDEEQLHFLDAIEDNPRFLVYGGAGSGKTLLARETVRRLKERGKRPVLLCFTKGLGQALREEAGLDAYTVKDFAVQLVQRAEIDLEVVNNPSQWDADTWALVTLQAAADCVPLAREDYDAFVIDEAQDFDDSDWELIKALAEGCPLYGFGDRAQGFWWNRNVNAELFGATFKLMKRYRCPEKLATFADLYRPRPKGEALPEDALADLVEAVLLPCGEPPPPVLRRSAKPFSRSMPTANAGVLRQVRGRTSGSHL